MYRSISCFALKLVLFVGCCIPMHGQLYISDFGQSNYAYSINTDGSSLTNLNLVSGSIFSGISVDTANNKVYWANAFGSSVFRADLDTGANVETIYSSGSAVTGVTVDVVNNKVYWADRGLDIISRSDLDGSNVETIASTGNLPRAISIDYVNGKLYWGDNSTSTITYTNLDGSNPQSFIGTSSFGIVADPIGGKLYWTQQNSGGGSIYRSNLDGSSRETLISGNPSLVNDARAIYLDRASGKIFWTNVNSNNGFIMSANLDGSNPQLVSNSASVISPWYFAQPVIIPEPSTYALILGGTSLLFIFLKLRKRRSI